MKIFRNPDGIHQPLAAYTHQIEIRGEERMLVLSGQVGMRSDGTLPDDPLEQLNIALENLRANLLAAEMLVEDLVKLTLFLVSEIDPPKRRAALAQGLGAHAPCLTLVYVTALANPSLKVEIDALASRAA